MKEVTLFGKKIPLPENGTVIPVDAVEKSSGYSGSGDSDKNISGSESDCSLDQKKVSKVEESEAEADKSCLAEEHEKSGTGEDDQHSLAEVSQNSKEMSECDNRPDTPSVDEDEDATTKQSLDSENNQSDKSNSQSKTLKKPDKILPCPRCNSMDTKFCYYNNYNVNQPRHFCKSCQRYWTAGGTMRNVPVGAGRRKSKNSSSHCHHITISEALQAAQMDAQNGFHPPNGKSNGTVLSFGSNLPICDSVDAVLRLNEKKVPNGCQNGFHKLDPVNSVSGKRAEDGDEFPSGSSITMSNSTAQGGKKGHQEPSPKHGNVYPAPIPYLSNVPCPFPTPMPVPFPAIYPPGFPMPIYPAPLWNIGIPGAWSFPWLPPLSPVAGQGSSVSYSNSPSLGKHSRDGELLKPKNLEIKGSQEPKSSEGSILVPKTLRIDDPDEAAKSSIWTTLGIKCDSSGKGGLFKALQPKSDDKKHLSATSSLLQANPAAFSRSITFQEIA